MFHPIVTVSTSTWWYIATSSLSACLVQIDFKVFAALVEESCARNWYEPLCEVQHRSTEAFERVSTWLHCLHGHRHSMVMYYCRCMDRVVLLNFHYSEPDCSTELFEVRIAQLNTLLT